MCPYCCNIPYLNFSLTVITLTVCVIYTTVFECKNHVMFNLTVFLTVDLVVILTHLLFVSKRIRRFWNTKSQSYFNMTLLEGGSCWCQTQNCFFLFWNAVLKVLGWHRDSPLKSVILKYDLLLVFHKRRVCLYTESKCQFDNEVHRQKTVRLNVTWFLHSKTVV
jgi:hypothetical protein